MEGKRISMSKTLMIFAILLLFIGGFEISFNNHSFKWIGLLEMVLNWFK